jgi:hypothetical protein
MMTDLNSYEESLANDLAKAEALIEELVKERDELGRKLNTARYGQPDFAWSIHEKEMADLRAKLAKAVEDAEKWRYAFAAQSRKLQAVLYIEGVKAVLAQLEGE